MLNDEIKNEISKMERDAFTNCGLIYELGLQKLFDDIHCRFYSYGPDIFNQALQIAKDMGYEQADATIYRGEGDCIHGIDADCCPAGCGDLEEYHNVDECYEYISPSILVELVEYELGLMVIWAKLKLGLINHSTVNVISNTSTSSILIEIDTHINRELYALENEVVINVKALLQKINN